MKKSLKTVLSLILTAAMLLTVMLPAFAATGKAADDKVRFNVEKVENGPDALRSGKIDTAETQMLPKGDVRVSIVLSDKATLEQGYSTAGIAANKAATNYRAQLLAKQNALAERISREILGGKKLDVKWNLTLAANIISANVPSTAVERIAKLDGVKKVVLEQQYEPAVAETNVAEPNMATSSLMTGATGAWSNGYTGLSSKVAVIDTGIDTDHKSYDADAFEYAVAESGKDVDLLTAEEVAAVYSQLNIADALPGAADAAYVSSKIPFALNYVDKDLDVTHDNDTQGEHGSHVAGIATANRFIKEADGTYSNAIESVQTQGAAPDAQLLVMKVFGKGGGAYDSDYMAAIEDAVVLGADSINLSLGSAASGFVTDDTYQEILDSFQTYDAVVSISAGNTGAWAGYAGDYGILYYDDNSYDTVGSPGSFANAFTAASVDNDGSTGPYIVADGRIVFYTETFDNAYHNSALVTVAGEHEFVYVDSVGRDEEFAAVADLLDGKVAVCNRGSTSFYQKANAAVENGAIATVVANNQAGTISMNLTGYLYTAPAISITQADGAYLKSIATASGSVDVTYYDEDEEDFFDETVNYYIGTLSVSSDALIQYPGEVDYHSMSSFSGFGVPGDLSLKPEITAPGGNIYSVNGLVPGGEAYESMSGTSMAAPQIAGLSAVLAQYIRENDLTTKTGLTARQLIQSLLMSTAEPMVYANDYGGESYYPVFQQGAGLADVEAAMNAKSYVMMDDAWDYAADGKVKAELGDDPDRNGVYSVSFSINNFSDEDVAYDLSADFFTQEIIPALLGDTLDSLIFYRDTGTEEIDSFVYWFVNGQPVNPAGDLTYDFNGDDLSNAADAVYLLDYVVGKVDSISDEDLADVDEDGDVDTYDAYQLLNYLNAVSVNAPAGESVDITAMILLPYGVLEEIYDYYYGEYGMKAYNGNYVEGYLYATEVDSDDGALGVTHSIPVLGYYGSWTEASMIDKVDYVDYTHSDYFFETSPYEPPYYLSYAQAFLIRYAGDTGAYAFGGNPAIYDAEYLPERNAINGENGDMILGRQDTLIRNIAGWRYTVTDKDGNDLIDPVYGGAKYGAYYSTSQGKWFNTSTTVGSKYVPSGLAEGDTVTFTVTYAPEYYLQADGSIDWDALGDGASKSITATIDNTAPELIDAAVVGLDIETGDWESIEINAKDNQYIAAIVVFNEFGDILGMCEPDYEAAAGEEMAYTLRFDELEEDLQLDAQTKLLVQVYDYAANVTNYKMNLDVEDLGSELTVTLPEYIVLVRGNSTKLVPEIEPWGADESLFWISGDETIATVDQNGVVTGVADGETYIAAFSMANPDVYAVCPVLVKTIRKDLNAVIWDEHGEVWYSAFNTGMLPDYTKLTEDSLNKEIASIAYGSDGNLYAASFDSSEWVSSLYVVDPDTFDTTYIGASEIGYMDLCPAYALGTDYMYAVYGPYIVIVDVATGDYLGVFDMSSYTGGNYFVGIAYEEFYPYTRTIFYDFLFLMDETGTLYEVGINNNFGRTDAYEIGNLGYETDMPYFNSLYWDGESLFWSRFNSEESYVDIIDWDASDTGEVFNLGSFEPDVWPVGGLFELEATDADALTGCRKDRAALTPVAEMETVASPIEMKGAAAKGSVHTGDADPIVPQALSADAFTQTVELKAADVATNGMITVTYDAENFTLSNVKSSASHYSYADDGNGTVTFGYINSGDKTFEKDDVVAVLTFITSGQADGTYTAKTEQINNEHPTDPAEPITVANDEHVFGEPTWSWLKTQNGFAATATFNCVAHANCGEVVIRDAAVEKTGETAQSCTEDEAVIYTATVTEFGKTYTDTYTDVIAPKTGHTYEDASAEATWTVRGSTSKKCSVCGEETDIVYTADTKLHTVMTAANNWAAGNGLDAFISGADTNGEDNTAVIALNVDGIWADADLTAGAFDGFMTAFGAAVKQYFGTDDVTIDGQAVYANGKFQNTAVKNALFGVGAGFFYKIANLGADGVYGVYDVTINGEAVALTVKFTGSEENLAKIKSFAGTISEHISAEVVDGNLVIDVIAPDQLVATVAAEYQGDKTVAEALKGVTVGAGLNIIASKNADSVFGSQVSAVNKLCAFLCKLSPLANKVLEKITEATVTLADGTDAALIDDVFDPYGTSYRDFLNAVISMLDDGLLARTVGEFTEEDGVYTLPVNVSVDMTNLGLMAGNTISETVIFNLHLFDNCQHPETVERKGYAATCTEDGLTDGTYCRICGKDVIAQEVIPAAHELVFHAATVTCTKDGNIDYYECSVCGKYFADENAETELTKEQVFVEKLGHDWDEGTVLKAPTCTDGGVLLRTCRNDPNHTKTEFIAPTGHNINAYVPAVEATCTEDGNVAYFVCSLCGCFFEDPYGTYEIDDVVVPATGHKMTKTEAKDATCTEDGNVEYYTCANCGKIFADANGATELTETAIPATGHAMTKTEAKAATCEADGNVEFYTCANCGKRFADEEGTTELEDVVVPATGHDWDDGTVLYPATCTEKGLIMFACNNDPSHIRFVALDMVGHNYKFDSFVWSEDGTAAQAKLVCANDAEHVIYEAAEVTSDKTDATCEADAFTVYTASYDGHTGTNTVTDKGSALGHDYNESIAANVTVVEATCTEAGSKTVKCSRCDATSVTEIPAKGHTMTKTAAKAATCTEDGNVEYYTCSVCGKIFADEKGATEITDTVAKAEGHKLVKTAAKAATCTEDGNVEYYTCSVCGKVFADDKGTTELTDTVVKAAGHKLVKTELKPATCTEAGNAEYWTCSVCGKVFADEKGTNEIKDTALPAEGHKLEKVEAVDATEDKEGNIAYYKCANCGKIFADAEGKSELAPEDVVIPKLDPVRKGDVDMNKELTANDARGALRIAVKLDKFTEDSKEFRAADVDDSNTVTAEDARAILRAAVKLDDPAWAAWTKLA